MDKSRLEISPGVWLDHRRAAFFERERVLAVADLHLGYAWAHRYNGQMLPLHARDDLLGRLSDLCSFYKPQHLAILGDIVHQALPVAEVDEEFSTLLTELSKTCGLKLILGNHDKKIQRIATKDAQFVQQFETADYLFLHGNEPVPRPHNKLTIIGHEHPAISIGDGIASARFPCFLVSTDVLVLPAFSLWSAGANIRACELMSPIARNTRFRKAIAICGNKLLPVAVP